MGTKKGQVRKTARRAYEKGSRKNKAGQTVLSRRRVYGLNRNFFGFSRSRSFWDAFKKK